MTNLINILLVGMGSSATGSNPLVSLVPLLLIIVVFYFFMIRPQMKRQKELGVYRSQLKRGDKVITTGGIYGKVQEVNDQTVSLEVDTNVHIKVDKTAVLKDPADLLTQK